MSNILNSLRDFLLRPPKFNNPSQDRIAGLQHTILIGLLVSACLSLVISLIFLSRSLIGYGIPIVIGIIVLISIFWQRRGHVGLVSGILITTLYITFLSTFSQTGFTFTSALILAIAISLAGLLLRPSFFIAISVFFVAVLWIWPHIIPFRTTALVAKPNELIYASSIIGLESILLIAASRTLERSFADLDRSTQNILLTNKDLENLATTLEQRVEERTQALSNQAIRLQAAAEISRTISSILDADELTRKVVKMVRERFGLYHVGLFLIDEDESTATLYAGAGPTYTPIVEINDQTAIGWAIAQQKARTVAYNESDQSEVRSEVALPLIAQGQVIGAMTLHSRQESAFSIEDVTILQTMTDQLANSIEKARLYEEIQQRARELERASEAADSAREQAERARLVAESANYSLAAQMWQTSGQAILNEKMRGEQDT